MMDTLFDKFCIDEDDDNISEKLIMIILYSISSRSMLKERLLTQKYPKQLNTFVVFQNIKDQKQNYLYQILQIIKINQPSNFIQKNDLLDFDADEAFSSLNHYQMLIYKIILKHLMIF